MGDFPFIPLNPTPKNPAKKACTSISPRFARGTNQSPARPAAVVEAPAHRRQNSEHGGRTSHIRRDRTGIIK